MMSSVLARGRARARSAFIARRWSGRTLTKSMTFAGALLVGGLGCSSVAGAADDQWGFEQVTPVNKAGGNVSSSDTFRASEDGSRLLYTVTAPFAGAPADSAPLYTRYVGRKVGEAWGTRAVDPPFEVIPPAYNNYIMGTVGSSVDLSSVLVTSTRALTPGAVEGGGNVYLRDVDTGVLTLVASSSDSNLTRDLAGTQGATAVYFVAPDGKGALFGSSVALTADAPAGESVLYGWTPDKGLYVVSRLPADQGGAVVSGGTSGGSENGLRRTIATRNALDRVYFRSSGFGVYLREGDNTVAVSRSQLSGDVEDAQILASSEDGEYALIETVGDAPLTNDTPVDPSYEFPTYWYRYSRSSGDLTYVGTNNPNGSPYGRALQMSADGRTIVIQSGFPLVAGAEPGAMNMFVWRDGELALVTSSQPPSSSTNSGGFLRLLSRNGRYYAFTDNDATTFARAGADYSADPCPGDGFGQPCDEVFVYDAEADELSCASCRPAGVARRGASGDPGTGALGFARMDQHQPQNIANDGTVWFTSTNDLLPAQDANGMRDVYASRDGQLRLVSRAREGVSSRFLDATADGGVVFISTDDPIARTDVDDEIDIYATGSRVAVQADAGPDLSVAECVGSDCRAPAGPSSVLEAPPVSQGGHGSQLVDPKRPTVVGKVARISWSKARLEVSVRVSGRGQIRVSGSGIQTAKRTVSRAGTYVVRTRLSASKRASLRRRGQVSLRVRTSFSPPFGPAVVSTDRKVVR